MKRKFSAMGMLLLPMLLTAAPLTPEQALERLAQQGPKRVASLPGRELRLARTELTETGRPAVYIFNRQDEKGYVVVSADDAVTPLLGYSDSGSLSGTLPPALEYWLAEYARQIEFSSQSEAPEYAMRSERPERTPIAPMITTSWDQDEPYYNMCPTDGAARCYTGCVATAMAQVMNYWKYPAKGKGTVSYDAETIQKRLELNFALRSFDWDNMIPNYHNTEYTPEQADAVAYLMKACGYAVKSDFGSDSTGALSMLIPRALTKYFGYDEAAREVLRQHYHLSEWEDLIYEQLATVGPVMYGGGSLIGGGHSFVCDGYDTDGYFHFNWGWTGMSNGYFLLDALNPYATGIGGGSGGGYNFTQDAIIGIQPPTGNEYTPDPVTLTQTGSLAAYIENEKLYFDLFAEEEAMFVNYEPVTLKLRLGAIVEAQNVEDFTPFTFDMVDVPFQLKPGYGTAPSAFKQKAGTPLADLNLPDGTYKLTAAILLEEDDAEWTPTYPDRDYFNYVYLHKSGSKYTVEVEDVDRLGIVDGGVIGDLYYGIATPVTVTVHNDSDHEMSRGFAPVIIVDNSVKFLGESIMLTVPPKSEVTRQWSTFLYSLDPYYGVSSDKEVYFTFFDESTYNFFTDDILKKMTMHPNPGPPALTVTESPSIENGVVKSYNKLFDRTTYAIGDPADIRVKARLRLDKGYFAYPMYAVITASKEGDEMAIAEYAGHDMIFATVGEEQDFETSICFPQAVEGERYLVVIGYAYGSGMYRIGSKSCGVVLDPETYEAGIDTVTAEKGLSYSDGMLRANGLIHVYSLDGRCLAQGFDTLSISSLTPGVYIAKCGNNTLKVITNSIN